MKKSNGRKRSTRVANKPARRKRAPRAKRAHVPASWLDGLALAAVLALGSKAFDGTTGPAACAAHGEVGGDRLCAACGHARRDHCFCGRECLAPGDACKCQGFTETAVVDQEVPQMFDGPGSPDDLMMRLWEVTEPVVGPVLDVLGIRRRP